MWRDLAMMGVMGAIAAAIAMLAPPQVQACGKALPRPSHRALYVARAEKALDDGDLLLATRSLELADYAKSDDAGLELRYTAVHAKLLVRRNSPDVDQERNPALPAVRDRTPEQQALKRQEDLALAGNALRSVADKRHRSPRALTDLAEALALHPNHRQEAKRILEDLAKRDLVTSAHGWAALARLRHAAADADATQAALTRCRQMSARPQVCRSADPGETPGRTSGSDTPQPRTPTAS